MQLATTCIRNGVSGVLVLSLWAGRAAVAQEYRYAIIDLGDIGNGGSTSASAINNDGIIVGSTIRPGFGIEAYVWNNGTTRYLERLAVGNITFAHAINDLGDIAGCDYDKDRNTRAVLWPGGGPPQDLGTLGGDEAFAFGLNNTGQVVGHSEILPDGSNPFIYENGEMTSLGDFGVPSGTARSINDLGLIVGIARGTQFHNSRGFLWEDGELINLGTLKNQQDSKAVDINEFGVIVGSALMLSDKCHAVVWENRIIRDIHDRQAGDESAAFGINESNQIVGLLVVDDFPLEIGGFLYENAGPMVALSSLVPPKHRWLEIQTALDINDNGQIVGEGEHSDGAGHGYLITPVTTELTLAQPSPGTANTINTLTVTGASPGKRVYFTYGTVGGGALVPGCNHTDGITVQIENPKIIGSAVANANGEASIQRFVPGRARNLGDILIQAVQQNGCKMSQLVVEEFE